MKDVNNVSIRVDHQLANVLKAPVNSKISFSDLVVQILEYAEARRLDDPESNPRDDMDPDRPLGSTVVFDYNTNGELSAVCNFCGHHIGLRDFALATCRRCNKHLSVKELVNFLFYFRALLKLAKSREVS